MTQFSKTDIQEAAKRDVDNTYPDVYRAESDMKNHAFAIAEQQTQGSSVQTYADAYLAAYQEAVEKHDAQAN